MSSLPTSSSLDAAQTIRKLLKYTVVLFLAPWATWVVCEKIVFPRLVAHMPALENQSATVSGVAAMVAVHVVLAAYVVSALGERNGFGRAVEEKRD
jgi:hypothetical protein